MKKLVIAAALVVAFAFPAAAQQPTTDQVPPPTVGVINAPGTSPVPTPIVIAQAAPSSSVDLGAGWNAFITPLLPAIAAALGTLLTGIAGMAIKWLASKMKIQGLELDAQHRDSLQTAITNAAALALNQLGNDIQGKTIDVKSPAVTNAIQVAMKNAPDAITYFKLADKPQEIAEKILAKIPQIANTNTPPKAAA
jgi:hypothetical protein